MAAVHHSHGRPAASLLFAAVRQHLEGTVQPALQGAAAYQNRVVLNLLGILERELASGLANESAELGRLQTLLGRDGTLDELNSELSRRIRDREIDIADPQLLAHLDALAISMLAVDNPGYSSFRRALTTRAP